jgi:glyoxalase family protein
MNDHDVSQLRITGLHHVTAIATDPQRNLEFYVGLLGLRLVKRTVNFDDPGSYHFYFGDAVGSPGTILTFFPWPGANRGIRGTGQVEATAFAVPTKSVQYWLERLREKGVPAEQIHDRFGENVIRFIDPDGMPIELIASEPKSEVKPWIESSVPEEYSIRGFHSVSLALKKNEPTAKLLTEIFGYQLVQEEANRIRLVSPEKKTIGKTIDLLSMPDGRVGNVAAGSVHHIAFRVSNDEEQQAWREKLIDLGFAVSPIKDRTYFHSIYFREPGGILFEIATDPPGFTEDETVDELGFSLRLPPWMEQTRPQIEQVLPPITIPTRVTK